MAEMWGACQMPSTLHSTVHVHHVVPCSTAKYRIVEMWGCMPDGPPSTAQYMYIMWYHAVQQST